VGIVADCCVDVAGITDVKPVVANVPWCTAKEGYRFTSSYVRTSSLMVQLVSLTPSNLLNSDSWVAAVASDSSCTLHVQHEDNPQLSTINSLGG